MRFREHSSPWKIALTAIVGAPIVAFFYLPWNIFTSWPVVIAGMITIAAVIALMTVLDERGPSAASIRSRIRRMFRGDRTSGDGPQ